jgi:hypothetical protein
VEQTASFEHIFCLARRMNLQAKSRFEARGSFQDMSCWKSNVMAANAAPCPATCAFDMLTCTLEVGHSGPHRCPNGHEWGWEDDIPLSLCGSKGVC